MHMCVHCAVHAHSVLTFFLGSDLLIGRVMSVARAMAPTLPHALLTKIQGACTATCSVAVCVD